MVHSSYNDVVSLIVVTVLFVLFTGFSSTPSIFNSKECLSTVIS
jgi:hypothetical protein